MNAQAMSRDPCVLPACYESYDAMDVNTMTHTTALTAVV